MRTIFIFILLLPAVVFSQTNDLGNWFIYFGDKKIDNRWNWHHEVQYRNFNFIGDIEQLLIRTGLGYNLTENNNNILLGAAFIYSEPYLANGNTKTSFNEHRIYQQFITRQTFGAVSLQHRYRFEQRFFEQDFRLRLRYFIGLNVALNKKQMMDKAVYLSAYNEIFINTENNIFDRNRLYGGLGYRFSKNVRTEIGVMNQSTSAVSRNQLNLITFFNF
ncbi:DUF2490 domain-containing protein [Riemerella anatipestifer]|uniref:DUF2490 domain-containing protein n=1 Tax=Riemerella anatipestifer TaxID=34085 RepID=A0AAP6HGU7_RIEAN|nr:DUF2490 domain-containing protein [Riemerella anatipestifer]MBT0549099.1 DUF2490 domain-containing protein [Riemerella anatipestifer]MBT0556096.1 DUF2490 domain-containing protein [Riemerella anatipestifer]MBT0559862.1 DUF2490 domain-containing protein [Riemerella anatipestifer]MCD5969078.1 DUF2490 domain-containing protein [Riemerella anatipestifer]MCO7354471.1 DUF2490 domain-containing protein [Riemerella anatipestifer]